jgi:hypothetical protein
MSKRSEADVGQEHSWNHLDWCLANPKTSEVYPTEDEIKQMQFVSSLMGRFNGFGCYEYCPKTKTYRLENQLKWKTDKPRYFRVPEKPVTRQNSKGSV